MVRWALRSSSNSLSAGLTDERQMKPCVLDRRRLAHSFGALLAKPEMFWGGA